MISLHKKRAVWFVEKGRVDLFKVDKRKGKPEGPRTFIASVETPGYLFSFDGTEFPFEIIAFPLLGSLIKEEPLEEFEKREEIQKWITLLGGAPSESLKEFHDRFLKDLLEKSERDIEEEQIRFQKKDKEEAKALSQSLKEMIYCINPEDRDVENETDDALFIACSIIGKFLKLQLKQPDTYPKERDVSEHVEAICLSSQMRKRSVTLEKNFWKKDSGPLLGFLQGSSKPVALIPTRAGRYHMIEPKTGEKTLIDEAIFEKLLKNAYSFYRTFEKEPLTSKEVLRFYLKTNLRRYLPLSFYSILAALISLFPPLATKLIFATAIPDANISLLVQVSIGLIISALSSGLFFFFRSIILVRIEGYGSHDMLAALWDRLLKLPVQFFRKSSAGYLFLRINALEQIRGLLSDKVVRTLVMGIFSSFYLIAMAIYSPQLTLISLSVILLSLIVAFICMRLAAKVEKQVLELQAKINGLLIQIISGIAKLRVAGAEQSAFSKWAKYYSRFNERRSYCQNIQNIESVVNSLMPLLSFSVIFGYSFVLLNKDGLTLSNFLAFNAAYLIFSAAIFELSGTILQLVPVKPLWNRVKVILDETPEIHRQAHHPGLLSGEIYIDELYFHYEKEGPLVLSNISMHIKPDECIGIVGPSGCGKSTLVRLLLRFEQPDSGAIYYGGKDLSLLNVHELRKQIGVVLQNGGIIAGTIYENIVCGGIYKQSQIEKALELSGFNKDLDELPMGFHTFLPMGGETLSGGQKQRLLIARALLAHPKILIFDEATSALDNQTQEEISRNIDQLGCTRIIIAHRLSTIRGADRIYLMDKGRIIDQGTFEELADRSELFAHMLHRQKL